MSKPSVPPISSQAISRSLKSSSSVFKENTWEFRSSHSSVYCYKDSLKVKFDCKTSFIIFTV